MAWSSDYRLAFIDASGDTTKLLSRTVAPLPVLDSAWATVAAGYAEFQDSWRGARCEGELARPDSQPILREIGFGGDGRLLVKNATGRGLRYDVYSEDLELVATFPAPESEDPSVPPFLYEDRFYVVTKDTLGVQRVEVYSLRSEAHATE